MKAPILGQGPSQSDVEVALESMARQRQGLIAAIEAKQMLMTLEKQMADAKCTLMNEEVWAMQQQIKQLDLIRGQVLAGNMRPQAEVPKGVSLR